MRIQKEIAVADDQSQRALVRQKNLSYRKKLEEQKKKEEEQRKEEQRKAKQLQIQKEQEKRLQSSCPENKVRTYACEEDNTRIVKYIRYEYDSEEQKCTEEVERKRVPCESSDYKASSASSRVQSSSPVQMVEQNRKSDLENRINSGYLAQRVRKQLRGDDHSETSSPQAKAYSQKRVPLQRDSDGKYDATAFGDQANFDEAQLPHAKPISNVQHKALDNDAAAKK